MSADCGSLLTIGLFFIFMAFDAYFKVFKLYSKFDYAGLTQAIMYVFELPPKQSCKIRVNFEFR